MRESSRGRSPRSKLFKEQMFSGRLRRAADKKIEEHLFSKRKLSRYGRAAVALWGPKPGQYMADKLGISKRNADQIIGGYRKVTAGAAALILAEII